ncbi:fungal-specific transcription factor domain-containing protein [Xylogone sp. PMI_703]|nr:fungal-specific transcription factor domain-containing protein [Xylogone sp. PMI_703]
MPPDFSSFTGRFRAFKDHTHDSSSGRVTKRPRESLVCNQCRRSKLRCDRGQPCGSCVKRDDAASCSYQRVPLRAESNGHHAAAEDRLAHLESLVKQLMESQSTEQQQESTSTSLSDVKVESSPELLQESIDVVDQVKNDRDSEEKYVGFTHWSAILDDIQELKVVLSEYTNTQQIDKTSPTPILGDEIIFGSSSNNYTIPEIISESLPPKADIDELVAIYFDRKHFTLPLIHRRHFQRQYEDFWGSPDSVNPLWLSILFSMACVASLLREANSTYFAREKLTKRSTLFHIAAGKCLVVGRYYRPQEYVLEALTLYAHYENLQSLEPSREAGVIFGMTIRMAYEMGYHRDPDSFGSFTVFEGEMRRRLWAVCKQMDLMTSFQLGLPSNICLENCDTKSPRNLLDTDFDVDTKVLPPSRPETEATRLLWFIVKDRQTGSFSKVCKDALSFREKTEAEILELDKEVREMHATVPNNLRTRPVGESTADPPFLVMTRLYIEFIYLKSLCVLHRKYMTRGDLFSTRTCIEAGMRLVSLFIDMFKHFAPGCHLHSERWMLTNFTLNDFLLGIMVLCLAVHIRRKKGSQNMAIDSATEKDIMRLLEQARVVCIESCNSRDAQRVSHAISIILSGSQFPRMSPTPNGDPQLPPSNGTEIDLASLSMQPQNEWTEENGRSYGWLDSFSFMGNEFDNIDWTMDDPLVSNQGEGDVNSFT